MGGMTDWTARAFEIKVDFLKKKKKWVADIWQDGINADRYAGDFKKLKIEVNSADSLKINLAPGGGVAIRFTQAR